MILVMLAMARRVVGRRAHSARPSAPSSRPAAASMSGAADVARSVEPRARPPIWSVVSRAAIAGWGAGSAAIAVASRIAAKNTAAATRSLMARGHWARVTSSAELGWRALTLYVVPSAIWSRGGSSVPHLAPSLPERAHEDSLTLLSSQVHLQRRTYSCSHSTEVGGQHESEEVDVIEGRVVDSGRCGDGAGGGDTRTGGTDHRVRCDAAFIPQRRQIYRVVCGLPHCPVCADACGGSGAGSWSRARGRSRTCPGCRPRDPRQLATPMTKDEADDDADHADEDARRMLTTTPTRLVMTRKRPTTATRSPTTRTKPITTRP